MSQKDQSTRWWEHKGRSDRNVEAHFKEPLRITDGMFFIVLYVFLKYIVFSYYAVMDVYDVCIMVASFIALSYFSFFWRSIRNMAVVVALLVWASLSFYGDNILNGDTRFFLKYLLASQPAVLWMCVLFFLSTFFYWVSWVWPSIRWAANTLNWMGVCMGFTALLVRWKETYLSGEGLGYIPISNLYEVVILFAVLTALFYLYYEVKYRTRVLGGFVMIAVSLACAFLLWYSLNRGAGQIGPLNNALNSWWMKLHVPANFVGYGMFALAAMVGVAYWIKHRYAQSSWVKALPSLDVLDDIMYRSISIGFVFFTLATVLGAFWAAEAWGSYWQWDPKETWALIVWLNYAAWLHMRLIKGVKGVFSAYWAIIGFFVTLFAFLGVNMFLSGLHSYGAL